MQGRRQRRRRLSTTAGLIAGLAMIFGQASATLGQRVVERQTRETGPRGRTIQRDVTIERSPGRIERDISITRPGGTFTRDTVIRSVPGGGWFGGGTSVVTRPGGRPTIVQNELIVNNPRPVWGGPYWGGGLGWGLGGVGLGLGVPGFGLVLGATAPPPVIVAPAPPPPVIIALRAPRPAVVTSPPPFDPVVDALNRLKSLHEQTRRDAALALGNLKAPPAVPALIDRLKNDWSKEVRLAAAWALGEIGDPRAGVALQRASLFDHRTEVRGVAAKAAEKVRQAQQTRAAQVPQNAPAYANPIPNGLSSDAPPVVSTPRPQATRPATPRGSLLDSDAPPPPTPYAPGGVPAPESPKN